MCHYLLDLGMPSSSIILVTPPPVHDEAWLGYCGLTGDRTFAKAQIYARATVEVARSLGVGVVNVFDAISQKENWRECLLDGVHLSSHGNDVVGVKVIEVLEERFKDRLDVVWSEWIDIHDTDYHSQLTRAKL